MITTAAEYYNNLYQIQSNSKPETTFRLPSWEYIISHNEFNAKETYYKDHLGKEKINLTAEDYEKDKYFVKNPNPEPLYDINLNTRTIKAPTYLSVARDHSAETIYFRCARFFDNVDLSEKVCIVQYINANNEGGLYVVPFYDITTEEGYMIFPWVISGKATVAAGNVKFAVSFYSLTSDRKFDYNLNTQAITSKVLYGLDIAEEIEEKYELNATLLDEINLRLKEYGDQAELRWLDLSELGIEGDAEMTDDDYRIINTIIGPKQ